MADADEQFLQKLYSTTRQKELALVDWDEKDKQAFLEMQFLAQKHSYLNDYPEANWQIIQQGKKPIGRLIVDKRPQEIGLMDISLLPPYRNRGIGSKLIKGVMAEANKLDMPVRLYVSKANDDARRLYQRLGFQRIGETGMHHWMEWRAKPIS